MMDAVNAVQDMIFWLIVGLLWLMWLGWKDLFRDQARQRLFAIRDELLLAAVKGEVPMSSDAHKLMRSMLNGAIRYMDRLTLFGVLKARHVLQHSDMEDHFNVAMRAAMDRLENDSEKKIIAKALEQVNEVLQEYLVRSNLIISTISYLALVLYLMHIPVKRASSWVLSKQLRKTMISNIFLTDPETGLIAARMA